MERLILLEVHNIAGRAHPVPVGEVSTATTAFPYFPTVLGANIQLSELIRARWLRHLDVGT